MYNARTHRLTMVRKYLNISLERVLRNHGSAAALSRSCENVRTVPTVLTRLVDDFNIFVCPRVGLKQNTIRW